MALASHLWAQDAQGVTTEGPVIQEKPNRGADGASYDEWRGALPVKIIESADEAANRRDREQKADQHEADDLAAQRKAANAAESGAEAANGQIIPTWIQAAVALIGTAALIYTLFLAREANRISRFNGEAQTRAYLGMKLSSGVLADRTFAAVPYLSGSLENTGVSPAHDVHIVVEVEFVTLPTESVVKRLSGRKAISFMLGQSADNGVSIELSASQLNDDNLALMTSANTRIHAYVTVEYVDVFDVKCRTGRIKFYGAAHRTTDDNSGRSVVTCSLGMRL